MSLLAAVAPAQHGFLERSQAHDGRWSAAACGGSATADLRVHTMVLLALLGDGSTARSGPRQDTVRKGLAWLRGELDDKGRFALRTDPGWLLDHAMAACVWVEEVRLAGHTDDVRLDVCVRCSDALSRELALRRPPPSRELQLWGELVFRSLRQVATALEDLAAGSEDAARMRSCAARLRVVVDGLRAGGDDSPRERAAAALLASVREEASEAPPMPAALLDDPMRTFYVALWHFRRGGSTWTAASARIQQQVLRAEIRGVRRGEGEDGSWDPTGEFGRENGRVGATAVAILLLEVYYRYCRLGVFDS